MKDDVQIQMDDISQSLEHLMLEPQMTEGQTLAGCALAHSNKLGAVCVKPCFVRSAVMSLNNSPVKVGTVIGFPHGSNTTYSKVAETKRALTEGAVELSMSVNLGYLLGDSGKLFQEDLRAVCGLARMNGAKTTIIIEGGLLMKAQLQAAAIEALSAGADWISSSARFLSGKPVIQQYQWIKEAVGKNVGLKAMGVIESQEEYLSLRKLGISRVAMSFTTEILEDILGEINN